MSSFLYNTLLLYSLFLCSISQKLPLPDTNLLSTDKISECQICKVLTESFGYWLEKTARWKFEGGDAAWEEAKLKSYARSEVRLVEIQEGLCSEVKKHQDKCYGLAEEVEQVIERWWFQEDSNSDLNTWLCTETLKHCCPTSHFGKECTMCAVDKDNKICGGRGRCDGDGTREGTGQCICKRGYTGALCQECSRNHYELSNSCEPCHKSCAECSGSGPGACSECASGWELQAGVCVDVDECARETPCNANKFCVNLEGSHVCKPCYQSCKTCVGAGLSHCTSCQPNHVLWSGYCLDDKLKSEILTDALRRLAFYSGLLGILYVAFRTSRLLASFVVIIFAIYIYIAEDNSRMSIISVGFNLLSTFQIGS